MGEFDPERLDISLAALFAGRALADEVQRRLARDGFGDVRFSDGVVFQHLVDRPLGVGALAERLDVTQQAASKAVADLERRGYVRRRPNPADARARLVQLTARGEAVMVAARAHRASLTAELADRLGAKRLERTRRVLLDAVEALGATDAVRTRRVRPPR